MVMVALVAAVALLVACFLWTLFDLWTAHVRIDLAHARIDALAAMVEALGAAEIDRRLRAGER